MSNIVVCRKCGGNHFTMKCSENKLKTNVVEVKEDNKKSESPKSKIVTNEENKSQIKNNVKPQYKKVIHKYEKPVNIKISELPLDITENELMDLTTDWGTIVRYKVMKYQDNAVAYLEFKYEDEAEYFIKALDRTPFDNLLLSVSKC
jgi:hypothetical protein